MKKKSKREKEDSIDPTDAEGIEQWIRSKSDEWSDWNIIMNTMTMTPESRAVCEAKLEACKQAVAPFLEVSREPGPVATPGVSLVELHRIRHAFYHAGRAEDSIDSKVADGIASRIHVDGLRPHYTRAEYENDWNILMGAMTDEGRASYILYGEEDDHLID